jgi:hypothetical protein
MPSRLYRILASEGLVAGLEKSAKVTTKKVTFDTYGRKKHTVTIKGDARSVQEAKIHLQTFYDLLQKKYDLQGLLEECEDHFQ